MVRAVRHFVMVKCTQWMFVLHNLIQGNFTDHQNITNPAECVSKELERFAGFTVEEKCFDRHEDSEYLQQCRYYIEVRIFSLMWNLFIPTLAYQGAFLTSICSLGFLANIITIVVIANYRIRTTFDKLLLSLAVIDCLVLLVFFVDSGLSKLDVDFPYWYNYVIPFIHFVKVLDKTPFIILEHENHDITISLFSCDPHS